MALACSGPLLHRRPGPLLQEPMNTDDDPLRSSGMIWTSCSTDIADSKDQVLLSRVITLSGKYRKMIVMLKDHNHQSSVFWIYAEDGKLGSSTMLDFICRPLQANDGTYIRLVLSLYENITEGVRKRDNRSIDIIYVPLQY